MQYFVLGNEQFTNNDVTATGDMQTDNSEVQVNVNADSGDCSTC